MTRIRHWRGFALSLLTAVLWGVLPVFLSLSLQAIDSVTITFYRFASAAIVVFALLWVAKGLPKFSLQGKASLLLVTVATIALLVNYVANVMSLTFVRPENVQVLMQIAPFMLMLGGVVFYAEKMVLQEWLGALVLVSGLLLFFNQKLLVLFSQINDDSWGNLLVVVAAISWAAYALLQKRLFKYFTAKQLTLLIYSLGALLLLPASQLSTLLTLNQLQLWALIFCCLNTLFAYGAFTEALAIWHAAKVSAVIALSPLFTFVSVEIAVAVWPQYFSPSDFGWLTYIGAAMVVTGSVTAALGKPQADLARPKA